VIESTAVLAPRHRSRSGLDRHTQKLSRLEDDRISGSKRARWVRHLEPYRWRTIYEADVHVPGTRENGPPPEPGVACRPGVKRAGDPLGNPSIMMRRLIGCDAMRLQCARITQVDRWGGQSG
jgi:hypothetical protein